MRISDWSSDVCSSDLDREPDLHALHLALLHLEHRKAIGDRRKKQHRGVERDQLEVEQILRRRSRGIAAAEHGIAGKEDREDEAVAHQIDPEAQHRSVPLRSKEHTSELQSLMSDTYADFFLKTQRRKTY